MEADFSGYATKAGLKCSDGLTIMPDAFKHADKTTIPLVYQHGHNNIDNVLGHAVLENRADGVYCYGYFNDSPSGQKARAAVKHGDIKALSIWANKLVKQGQQVFHGMLREVSLVLAGANPGAFIDYVNIAHGDDSYQSEDDIIIFSGENFLTHFAGEEDQVEHAEDGASAKDVYNSLTDDQKKVVEYMLSVALDANAAAAQSDTETDEDALVHQKETEMPATRNVFDTTGDDTGASTTDHALSHDDMKAIVVNAQKLGSLKEAVEAHALAHGITNLAELFPDAKNLTNTPEWNKRRTEWVAGVLNGTKHTPFSRIKTLTADLTFDDARAKGYVTGDLKKEEYFSLASRETYPQTIYKKQKLDRDDIIDITDFDVVAWMRGEMRIMLEEELAGAVLVGDGRDVNDEDKIQENKIRPIAGEDDLYARKVFVNIDDANSDMMEVVDALIRARIDFRGTGTPTMYCGEALLTELLLLREVDSNRRLYRSVADLASELRVSNIVVVDVMDRRANLLAIVVNLEDYSLGADKGGAVSLFDDFDIDYNQYKYLIETRCSGALTKFRSALVLMKTTNSSDTLVTPTKPAFDGTTNTITIPTVTGVQYKIGGVNKSNGSTVVITENTYVDAVAKSGYYSTIGTNTWGFTKQ